MLSFIVSVFALVLSFYLLAKICDDYFVPALETISEQLNLPDDVAGATLMAVGSSAPELFISLFALLVGSGEHAHMGAGTIVGSALFNLLVITGATALVCRAQLQWQVLLRDLSFYGLSIVWLLHSFWDGQISSLEAWLFLGFYLVYLSVLIFWQKMVPPLEYTEEPLAAVPEKESNRHWLNLLFKPIDKSIGFIFERFQNAYLSFSLSVLAIAALSWLLVEQSVVAAHFLNIPEAFIALTILAAGTSIPDLMSSLIVARKGKGAMSLSNAVGSNIFDIFVGLGLPWVLVLLLFNQKNIVVETEGLMTSAYFLLGSVVLVLLSFGLQGWKVTRKTGYLLLGSYAAYLIYTLYQGLAIPH